MSVTAPGVPDRFTTPLYTVTEAARYLDVPASTLTTWTHGCLLRELSARLRRLLIDGILQLYRKQVLGLRGEPSVNAPARFESAGAGTVFAQAGGATRDGLSVEGVTFWNRALSAEEIKARYEEGLRVRSQPRALRLSV